MGCGQDELLTFDLGPVSYEVADGAVVVLNTVASFKLLVCHML